MARSPWAEAVYDMANRFREHCLIHSSSMLWPDDEVWTLENLAELERVAFNREDPSVPSDLAYWDDVSRTLNEPLRKLGTDLAVIYQLFPSKSATSKLGDVRYMLDGDPPLTPHQDSWSLFEQAAQHGLGDAGRWYLSGGQQWSVLFYLKFAMAVKTTVTDVYDRAEMQSLADEVERSIRYNTVSARHMILHLLFPDDYEPTSAQRHKDAIRSAFTERLGINPTDDIDRDIKKIREQLASEGREGYFGFYDPDIRPLWDHGNKNRIVDHQESSKVDVSSLEREQQKANNIASLQATTHLDSDFLREINALLIDKRQLIFEGPPGSGKTYVAEKFARWFTGQPLESEPLNERIEIVQFHQSYGYEDFVQGIRPETNGDGQLVYRVRDGIFLDMCERARANPEDRFVLIIDEINRGNISRIFGELLLLLEYRNQSVRLPYGSGDAKYLTIPENLYLIGTMNTADRSLAQIDYALRRRFYFVRFMPVENGKAEVFSNWLAANGRIGDAEKDQLLRLFVNLNDGIREHLHTDDLQIGHSYFMQDDIRTDAGFERVWRRAVRPLLEEYLHHHRNREDILAALTPETLVNGASPGDEVAGDGQVADSEMATLQ